MTHVVLHLHRSHRYAALGGIIAIVVISAGVYGYLLWASPRGGEHAHILHAACSWLVVPLAVYALLYRPRYTAILLVANLLAISICATAIQNLGIGDILPTLLFLTVVTAILSAFATIRERDRQTVAALRARVTGTEDAKRRFLASMSHEMHTPMNAIVGMTALLKQTALTAAQRDHVATIDAGARSLMVMVDDVLEYSKLEADRVELSREPFVLTDLAEHCIDLIAPRLQDRPVELLCRVSQRLPRRFLGDAARLRQMLNNLLENAARHTDAGEVVLSIDGHLLDDLRRLWFVSFSVRDTGAGIPADRLDDVFAPFVRGNGDVARRESGAGLSLAICKKFAELMDGRVHVDSEPGRGSTFRLEVHLRLPEEESLVTPPTTLRALQDRRVVIVDDNATSRRILDEYATGWGLAVTCADSGAAALELLASEAPACDVLVIDRDMPDMDGLQLVREVRARRGQDVFLILLDSSGAGIDQDARQQLSGVLRKPVRSRALRELLLNCLDENRSLRASSRSGKRGAQSSRMGEQRPLHILIAEDNAINRKVALYTLARLGYAADAVVNGVEAIDSVTDSAYDLILMDLDMPEMDGLEATRQIRTRDSRWPRIVALTASTLSEERTRCMEAGMNGFMSKPLDSEELVRVLKKCYARKQRDHGEAGASSGVGRPS